MRGTSGIKIFLLIVTIVLLSAVPSVAQEVITNYDSHINILQDSSLYVTEKITVNIENSEIIHGIQRFFPVKYKDSKGKTVKVGFTVDHVLLDGQIVPWKVKNQGRDAIVRIGDADYLAPRGLHTYTIVYTTTRQLGFFEEHDELYWNVTGNYWNFPIQKASCTVSLPGTPPGQGYKSIEWYTGRRGAQGQDAAVDSTGKVETTKPLRIGEGLTVVYTWEKGLLTPPPLPLDYGPYRIITAGVVFVLTLLWLCIVWFFWGIDPPRNSIPIYTPPDDLSAPFMRYIKYLQTDSLTFAATIISLGVKGALEIYETETKSFFKTKKHYRLVNLLSQCKSPLTPEEQIVMGSLFMGPAFKFSSLCKSINNKMLLGKINITSDNKFNNFRNLWNKMGLQTLSKQSSQFYNTVEVSKENGKLFADAIRMLDNYFKKEKSKLYTSNLLKLFVVVPIYFLGVFIMHLLGMERRYVISLFTIGLFGHILWFSYAYKGFAVDTAKQLYKQIFFILIPVGYSLKMLKHVDYYDQYEFLIMLASAFLVILSRPLISRRTEEGARLLEKSEGLELYMKTAEEERLNMFAAGAPEDTPEVFERMLPYALALDCAKTWGNRFADKLERTQYKPEWYVGNNQYLFIQNSGLNDLSKGLSTSIAQSLPSSAPGSSSGAGGGGFSGGGGGGGGGGGW